jgi:hypothetical protein
MSVRIGAEIFGRRLAGDPTLPASGQIERTMRLGGLCFGYRQARWPRDYISEPHT